MGLTSRSVQAARAGSSRARSYASRVYGGSSSSSSSASSSYTAAIARAGITRAEWNSMNAAARAAVQRAESAGTLRASGTPDPTGSLTTAKSLTVVNRQGEPVTKYTAVTERFTVQNEAAARVRGVVSPGSYQRRTLYSEDVRENYPDFGTGRKVPIQRELGGSFSTSPLLSSQIENVAGIRPRVEFEVVERKEPGLFGSGRLVTETTVTPPTKAQAQLLTSSRANPLGSPAPVALTLRETRPLPSRLDQRISPLVKGTVLEGVAIGAGKVGTRLVDWAEPRLAASEERLRVRGSVPADNGQYAYNSFVDTEPWKRARYAEVAGVGGFLQGAGETTLTQPSRIITGGVIGGSFVLLTRGAGAGAGAITGKELFAVAGRQTLLRTSQLATVGGYAATGLYGADVAYRFERADGPAARGRVLGGEVPGLAGVFAGGKVVGTAITGVQQSRAVFTARGALGRPLTEVGVERLGRAAEGAGADVIVTGRELKGVSVRAGAVSDQFGIRGLTEQRPILGQEQTFPLGEAPRTADYYAVGGSGRGGVTGAGGATVIRPFEVSRVVTGGVAAGAASPRVSSYNYPELSSSQTGIKGVFSGEAALYFSPVKAGVVRSTTGRGVAADTQFYRDFQSDLAFRRMVAGVEVVDVSPPARPPGLRSSRPVRSPSLFRGGETIVSSSRVRGGDMGGLARPGAEPPGYDFTIGGQRARLLFDTWEPQLKQSGGGSGRGGLGVGDGPFIVEGLRITGQGRGRGGLGVGGQDFSVIGSLSGRQGRGSSVGFGFGSSLGSASRSISGVDFAIGGRQMVGSTTSLISDSALRTDRVTETIQDQIITETPPPREVTGGDYGFTDFVPKVPTPEVPLGGGFALPFGGGRGGRGRGGAPRTRFRTGYNPSIAAEVFGIRGSRRQGLAAARTGISVRPIV